ncbi:hypothetical protein [Dyadobacter psychrophilus]|uniref:Uncharacterized protein n=1 Tax=Dyadobacter psychrophilus TaxID=651661 RepID=A0A1T5BXH4_9BACT|nr:hypothetical protein [Dyadobacter psychrophilus]SKB52058.1 hypothetical protein SAMN05660293_00704 [Dyadobacter psychrophilus]
MKLTRNFTLEEMIRSSTASREASRNNLILVLKSLAICKDFAQTFYSRSGVYQDADICQPWISLLAA